MQRYSRLLELVRAGQPGALITALPPAEPGFALYGPQGREGGGFGDAALAAAAVAEAGEAMGSGRSCVVSLAGGARLMVEVFLPPPTVVIYGCGHIGQALARLSKELDYRVVVFDDRPAFASAALFPTADSIICRPFTEATAGIDFGPQAAVVIVTRGHMHDEAVLRQVLRQPAGYLGVIGSRRRVAAVLNQLAADGEAPQTLERIKAPIGLDIGAETPAEIALAVLAEITQVRRGGSGMPLTGRVRQGRSLHPAPVGDKPGRGPGARWVQYTGPTSLAVLEALAEAEQGDGRAALVTIIETRGATPRRAGAKMAVLPDGRMIGTIGGGCGESEVRQQALYAMDTGLPLIYQVDLADDIVRSEREVCGGVMDVLVEPVGKP